MSDPLASHGLAAFVAAVECGTVQGAAEALSLTQSAVTKRIQALERRVGGTLLKRARTGVALTDRGRSLYPEARRALDALAAAEQAVTGETAGEVLPLAASHTVGEFLLPGWLGAFRILAPTAHPQVEVVNSPAVLKQLRAGVIDVGFVEGDDPVRDLQSMIVGNDEIVVVVASDHRWSVRQSLCAADLNDEPYLAREAGSGTRAVVEARLLRLDVWLTPALELGSLEGVKRALPSGGFTLMSRWAVESEVQAGTLRMVPLSDARLTRRLLAVRADRPGRHQVAEDFWQFLGSLPQSRRSHG